jgi:hypothetical protein
MPPAADKTQTAAGDGSRSWSQKEKLFMFVVAFTSVVLLPVLHFGE